MCDEWRYFGKDNCYRANRSGFIESCLLSGRISKKTDKWRRLKETKGATDGCGGFYLKVGILKPNKKTSYRLHRLIAELFLPNPNHLPEVNHINGDRMDTRVENLEWCTRKHNARNAADRGSFKDSRSFKGKIDEIAALAILTSSRLFRYNRELADIYNVDKSQISRILTSKSGSSSEWFRKLREEYYSEIIVRGSYETRMR